MKLRDYHTHSRRCGHGLGEIEDYVKSAIVKNLNEIGIADHFPIRAVNQDPELRETLKIASMEVEEFPRYIKEIKGLKEKYKNKIDIRISTEVGFYTPGGALSLQKEVLEPFMDDIDYILGGIHDIKWHDSPLILLDPSLASEIFGKYGKDKIILEYLNKLIKLVDTTFFDVIAHFDYYRMMYRPNKPIYSQNIWQKLLDLLDNIKNKGMAIEINTSASRKSLDNQFPDDKIIKEIIQRKIPLLLGSDAHKPEEVGYMFEETLEKVKKWGLTHLCVYENREQKLVKI
ncbi:MAG: histidinol-phosphatase [Candidatus Lokiarchaeota archaeon]|nr:histidinol-phosphatase [Candidatus Lokiarchaeota archaeon]